MIILIILLYSYFYIYKKVTSFTVPHVYDTVNVYPKKNMNYSGQYVLNKNNFICGEDDYFIYYCVVLYVKYITVAEFMFCVKFGMSKMGYGVVTMTCNIDRLLVRLFLQRGYVLVRDGSRPWALDGEIR
jgi:hypothetical protein